MRTTVTLDPDVERLVKEAMRKRDISFKEALNEAARIGLSSQQPKRLARYTQRTFSLGGAQEFRWDKALALADAIEDEEIGRKILLRK